jgi:putative ABC transport system permease protein
MLNDAPAFYFIDIQPEQVAEFDAITAASPGIGAIERVPWLRGRIVKVAGRPSEDVTPAPDQRWVLRGDRGLTFAEKPPAAAEIVAGVWWPANYDGPPLVSLTEDAAIGLGIGIGDSIAVNVLGREVEARIGSLRRVVWSGMGLNFVMIFSPNTLAGAPISYLATVKATSPAAEDRVWRAVTDRFANVSAIRMKEVLEEINGVLTKLDIGLNIAAAITWIAGVLVLGGAVVAGHRRRTREVAIFKVLGAMRGEVIRAHLLEYAAIGLVSAALAGAIGWLGAWAVVVKVMHANWTPLPATLIGTTLISLAATGILGLAGTWRALAEPTAAVLRQP